MTFAPLFLSQSSSLLTSLQTSSEVPSAAELVSAIEKLVKTKMVSAFDCVHAHMYSTEQHTAFHCNGRKPCCADQLSLKIGIMRPKEVVAVCPSMGTSPTGSAEISFWLRFKLLLDDTRIMFAHAVSHLCV